MNSAYSQPSRSISLTDDGHAEDSRPARPQRGSAAEATGNISTRPLLAIAVASVLTACGTPSTSGPSADYSSNSSLAAGGSVNSPAAERVVDGVVELALTDALLPDFDAARARARRLGTVHDGQDLYLYLRSTRPLGEIAHPVDPNGKNSFSGYPHLFVQIGDNQSLRIINTCYVTLTPAEAKATQLIVPLAPLTNRVGDLPTDCWLETVTHADSVRQTMEVRLAGFPGKFESWLPVPDLLGVVEVDTDLSKGSGAWARMLRAKPGRSPDIPAAGISRDGSRHAGQESSQTLIETSAGRSMAAERAGQPDEQQQKFTASPAGASQVANDVKTLTTRDQRRADQRETIDAPTAATIVSATPSIGTGRPSQAPTPDINPSQQIFRNEIVPINRHDPDAVVPADNQQSSGGAAVSGQRAAVDAVSHNSASKLAPTGAQTSAIAPSQVSGVAGYKAAPALVAALPAGAHLMAVTPLRPAPRQAVGTQKMAQQLQSLSSTLLGREPSETYFIDRRWHTQRERGTTRVRSIQTIRALAIFRGEECSWQSLLVTRRPGSATLTEVAADGDEVRIACPELKSAP